MKFTWVWLLSLGVVSADVGLGYRYKVPQTSYGVPSYQAAANSGQFSSAFAGSSDLGTQSLNGYQGFGHQNSGASFQTGNGQVESGLGSGYLQSSGSSSAGNIVQPTYQYTTSSGVGTGYQNLYESSQYQASALNKYQQYYQFQQQPAKVFKHFYVHSAPEEPEQVKLRAPIVLPPPEKHYKIIFVKAPSEASAPRVIAPVQPQNEEKTIVYVLVKKPEEQAEVVLPKIEQKPPSKPEVYFIKYKNKDDSQAVINDIVNDYSHGQSLSSSNSHAGDNSYQSGFGNVHYQTPSYQEASTNSFGSNAFGLSGPSGSSVADLSGSSIASSIASPVTVSSTASSIGYGGDSVISTQQGVPHETYGPPKFREN